MNKTLFLLALARAGPITAPGDAPFGSRGQIIHCPIAFRFI